MDVSTTCEFLGMFPAPLEVDRYLYSEFNRLKKSAIGFRPLAGRIDCSTRNMAFTDTHVLGAFPAPLEVDRFLYGTIRSI